MHFPSYTLGIFILKIKRAMMTIFWQSIFCTFLLVLFEFCDDTDPIINQASKSQSIETGFDELNNVHICISYLYKCNKHEYFHRIIQGEKLNISVIFKGLEILFFLIFTNPGS